ncbi:D-alanyl-D-alanine carboxypeptidase family protein [Actinoplanes sp. NPDC051494]|uniref:D-alanyl-D-alanine carboxypeptidase family protein n=1 Tax=Actinoplanes sp. NPDC051494 TaxID=3363907 RepID=UPI0037B905F8
MGIEGVNSRIAAIQSRMIAMQTQQATKPSATTTTAAGGSGATTASGASFATALQSAMGAQATSAAQATTAAAPADKTYSLNGKGIPTELAAYGNGKIPANALEKVGSTGHKLWAPAAQSLNQMMADAKADGVTIGITDSYRPYEEQVDLAKRKGLYSQGGLAAKPGTSEHGWGMATDLDLNSKAQTWMRANGEKYGFTESVPREPWHWSYKPRTA